MLNKIYKDDDKFGGLDDNLSFKVTIFYTKYRQVGFSKDTYIQDMSIILWSQLQTYYYANHDNNFIFDPFYSNIQSFFESFKWQCFNLTK